MSVDVAILDGLLSADGARDLHAYAVEREADFSDAKVLKVDLGDQGTVDHKYRRNLHLRGGGTVPKAVMDRIRTAVPTLARTLDPGVMHTDDAAFAAARYEAEITVTLDGGYFTAHSDNAHPRIEDRFLTFVYFFGMSPRRFTGGELCVERNWRDGDRIFFFDATPGDEGLPEAMVDVVAPEVDRLVVFRGDRTHEVRPVVLPSGGFAAARFTVTGWVRTRPADA